MKQLLDFIPLILFFVAYKIYGVQAAALTLTIATLIQVIILKVVYKTVEKKQWVLSGFVIVFALLTAYFNDMRFLQWKVTLINALFAIILLVSQYGFKKPLIKLLLGSELKLPDSVWAKLNLGWAGFFLFCMLVNIIISQFFSEEVWATFKVFGFTGLSLLAVIGTTIFLYPYLKTQQEQTNGEQNGN